MSSQCHVPGSTSVNLYRYVPAANELGGAPIASQLSPCATVHVTALVALTVSRTMRSRALPGFSAGSVSVVSVDTATAFTARSAR